MTVATILGIYIDFGSVHDEVSHLPLISTVSRFQWDLLEEAKNCEVDKSSRMRMSSSNTAHCSLLNMVLSSSVQIASTSSLQKNQKCERMQMMQIFKKTQKMSKILIIPHPSFLMQGLSLKHWLPLYLHRCRLIHWVNPAVYVLFQILAPAIPIPHPTLTLI